MTNTGKMVTKLIVLIIPAVILLFLLYGDKKGNGIGGGSYDLSEMVYSGLYSLYVLCWNLWIMVLLLMAKTAADKHSSQVLLIIGIITLIAAVVWFFKYLN
jgi:hypothetical protein